MPPDTKAIGKVKGDVRRDQIMQATLKIIARKGVSSLTTAALAREVGISEANLYRHFRNKDEIYMATVTQVQEMIAKNLENVLADDAPILSSFKTILHAPDRTYGGEQRHTAVDVLRGTSCSSAYAGKDPADHVWRFRKAGIPVKGTARRPGRSGRTSMP